MNSTDINGWQDIQLEVLQRIHSRIWKPGELIPNEAELAEEFGCARATVNRALRAVADAGLLDRKRKAGTRVAIHPVRKATLNIPVIRHEIEARNQTYSCALISSESTKPPTGIRTLMKLDRDIKALHLRALHFGDNRPYVYEDRWINSNYLPKVSNVDFEKENANEWLLTHAPFTTADFTFFATAADKTQAEVLDTKPGEALLTVERSTWHEGHNITFVKLFFAPGYRMHTSI